MAPSLGVELGALTAKNKRTGIYTHAVELEIPVTVRMAHTPLAQGLIEQIKEYSEAGRFKRGADYARTGHVRDLDIGLGIIAAHVTGSQLRPFETRVSFQAPKRAQRDALLADLSRDAGARARFSFGELSDEHAAVFDLSRDRGNLFHADCSCPDPHELCKHVVAVVLTACAYIEQDPRLMLEAVGLNMHSLYDGAGARTQASVRATPAVSDTGVTRPYTTPEELAQDVDGPETDFYGDEVVLPPLPQIDNPTPAVRDPQAFFSAVVHLGESPAGQLQAFHDLEELYRTVMGRAEVTDL